MNRETFLETVKQHLADEIHEAYLECEHDDGRSLDVKKLDGALGRLMKNAKAEGLSEKEFEDLVRSTLPEVADQLALFKSAARAAA